MLMTKLMYAHDANEVRNVQKDVLFYFQNNKNVLIFSKLSGNHKKIKE